MNRTIYTVTQIVRLAKDHLESKFPDIWVEGEISNFKSPTSTGHIYFILKDETSQVESVIWSNNAKKIKFELENGLHVIAHGRLTIYPERGKFEFIIDKLEPVGIGALQKAFEDLKNRLQKEGLFDKSRKRPLPLLPQRIGVVTSARGAAIRDILTVMKKKFANVEILIYDVAVQGDNARFEIVQAIEYLNKEHPYLDVLLVGRGGGSLEDLWAFNEEIVARAIASSKIPVISAVGHEIDYTIADFVADFRAATPTSAAEIVVQSKEILKEKIINFYKKMEKVVSHQLEISIERFDNLKNNRIFQKPMEEFVYNKQRILEELLSKIKFLKIKIVDNNETKLQKLKELLYSHSPYYLLSNEKDKLNLLTNKIITLTLKNLHKFKENLNIVILRMKNSIQIFLKEKETLWKSFATKLNALSPLAVLERGYSITYKVLTSKIIKDASEVNKGEKIDVRLHKGRLICEVTQVVDGTEHKKVKKYKLPSQLEFKIQSDEGGKKKSVW